MADRSVRVENESWTERLGGSIKGIFAGLVLALLAAILLFWNEGRAVRRAQALAEGARSVQSVDAGTVDPAMEGRLVHLSGRAESSEVLRDVLFRVSSEELRLIRSVEMYQWKESKKTKTEKKVGGGTRKETVVDYERVWADEPISSGSFEEPAGHENPPFPIEGETWTASPVTVGAFTLGDAFVGKIGSGRSVAPDPEALPEQIDGTPLKLVGSEVYVGDEPLKPEIGDLKVTFQVVPEGEVSAIGQQQSGTIVPYTTSNRGSIALLSRGVKGADQMFERARSGNRTMTWILRLVGFVAIWSGFAMVLRPLSVLADVIPAVGNFVEAGTGIIAGLGAAFVSLVVVAIGWIFYRPWLGILILVLALAVLVWFVRRMMGGRRRRKEKEGVAASPGEAPAASAPESSSSVPPPPSSTPPPPPPPPGG